MPTPLVSCIYSMIIAPKRGKIKCFFEFLAIYRLFACVLPLASRLAVRPSEACDELREEALQLGYVVDVHLSVVVDVHIREGGGVVQIKLAVERFREELLHDGGVGDVELEVAVEVADDCSVGGDVADVFKGKSREHGEPLGVGVHNAADSHVLAALKGVAADGGRAFGNDNALQLAAA